MEKRKFYRLYYTVKNEEMWCNDFVKFNNYKERKKTLELLGFTTRTEIIEINYRSV